MSIAELLRKKARAQSDDVCEPKGRFGEANRLMMEAMADALSDGMRGEGPEGEEFVSRWFRSSRARARELWSRALRMESVAGGVSRAFRDSRSYWSAGSSIVQPFQVLMLLTRDERVYNMEGELVAALDRHVAKCECCPPRCQRLGEAAAGAQQGVSLWFGNPALFPNTCSALEAVERKRLSVGDLTTYILDKRRFDCVSDLALSPEEVDKQAFKLVGWAKDAAKLGRGKGKECPLDDNGLGAVIPGDVPMVGIPSELLEVVRRVRSAACSSLSRLKHLGDRILMELVWEMMRCLHTDAAAPDAANVGLSDVLRAIAVCYRLPELVAAVEKDLGNAPGRWRRKVLRLGLVAAVVPELLTEELEHISGSRKTKDSKLTESLASHTGQFPPLQAGVMALLVPDECHRLERQGQEDKRLESVNGQLRDMYDEVMRSVAEDVAGETGFAVTDPAAVAGLVDLFREGSGPFVAALRSCRAGDEEHAAGSVPDDEVTRLEEGRCFSP